MSERKIFLRVENWTLKIVQFLPHLAEKNQNRLNCVCFSSKVRR